MLLLAVIIKKRGHAPLSVSILYTSSLLLKFF